MYSVQEIINFVYHLILVVIGSYFSTDPYHEDKRKSVLIYGNNTRNVRRRRELNDSSQLRDSPFTVKRFCFEMRPLKKIFGTVQLFTIFYYLEQIIGKKEEEMYYCLTTLPSYISFFYVNRNNCNKRLLTDAYIKSCRKMRGFNTNRFSNIKWVSS